VTADSHHPAVRLAPGKEKSLLRRHPWVFSGAILEEPQRASSGQTVDVFSTGGEFLARAAWSPESQIRARVWTFDDDEAVDEDFFRRRIVRAIELRRAVAGNHDAAAGAAMNAAAEERSLPALPGWNGEDNAIRLIHGESDGLPGLVVDRYDDTLVCQFLSAGTHRWQREIVQVLAAIRGVRSVYERSDADVRDKEGLAPSCGLLAGIEPPPAITILENGCRYRVDVREGHKTGFYLDQRRGREAAARWCRGRDVLNAFAYTGGFSVAALAGGAASVVDVDTSASALELARANVEANALDPARYDQIHGDVFTVLRRFRDSRRTFDAIVLDPPKFADARAHLDKAARGYKDINLLALKLLRPGGILLTFSCSGQMTNELFQKIVADSAVDARRNVVIVEKLAQASDHPVLLAFPEGAYLKGLVCRAE